MDLILKRSTNRFNDPGEQIYDVICSDGPVRKRIGGIRRVDHAFFGRRRDRPQWSWGILGVPPLSQEDSGEAATRDDAMKALRQRWDRMSDDWKRQKVLSWCPPAT